VAVNSQSTFETTPIDDNVLRNSVKLGPLKKEDLSIKATGPNIRVIGVVPGQIVTEHLVMNIPAIKGYYEADPEKDLCKLVVWNRYGQNKPPAKGFIWGLGLKRGAIASTVSHDSHHLIAAGVNNLDLLACAEELEKIGGGLALACEGRIIASLALPLGGLMSDLSLEKISNTLDQLRMKGTELGFTQDFDPFMTLAFMSLPVIPSLKLTAEGLVDVATFEYVPVVFG
jgi:adenine deaminase